jgi:hypothetical protein
MAEPKRTFTIEQAGNFLEEKKKTLKADVQAEANQHPITTAPEEDRIKYLEYCVSLLEEVDSDLLFKLPDNIRTSYTKKGLAGFFKAFLKMRINGASNKYIAKMCQVPLNVVDNINILAQEAMWRRIKHLRTNGIPLVGHS